MTKHRRIYLLSPKDLSAEAIAVAFAKTSRSPKPFDAIASELTDEGAAQFHEKWVVGYGHASVAEHAVLHLALENVSRLAIETIENNRLASYTEKSTRYQKWDEDAFYIPDELQGHALEEDFIEICTKLFQTYQNCIPKVKSWLQTIISKQPEETEKAYQRRIQPATVDICRFLLPAASLANVGVTINARALEYAICKMLSSSLAEVRSIGEQLREVGENETPTLIKYASCNDYLVKTRDKFQRYTRQITQRSIEDDFKLLSWDKDGQESILAGVLFRFGQGLDYEGCLDYVKSLPSDGRADLTDELMANRGQFDQPLREFEYAQMTFEVVMDQGAYFEFKRHRMMTQTVEPLSPDLGFAVPRGITASGCEEAYLSVMRRAAELHTEIASWNPHVASYIIPNGFNRRVLFTMNLRQAFHFCKLRAAKNAHFSIRRISQKMHTTLKQIYPDFGRYLPVPHNETSQEIEDDFFTALALM